jgi:hypothetical protein
VLATGRQRGAIWASSWIALATGRQRGALSAPGLRYPVAFNEVKACLFCCLECIYCSHVYPTTTPLLLLLLHLGMLTNRYVLQGHERKIPKAHQLNNRMMGASFQVLLAMSCSSLCNLLGYTRVR